MSDLVTAPAPPGDLRARAVRRLGTATGAADALAVLHALASSPDTAADALALLHELQVHQVELDLQADEMHASRAELESTLRRQIAVYEHLPVGCFSVDDGLVVQELNLTAARMLGIGRDEACGLPLDGFLAPDSARTLRAMVSALAQGRPCAPAALHWAQGDAARRGLRADVGPDPRGQGYLVVLAAPI